MRIIKTLTVLARWARKLGLDSLSDRIIREHNRRYVAYRTGSK